MARFAACLFDLDGVLADSMPQHARAYQAALAPYQVTIAQAEVFRREGMNARAVAQELLAERGIRVDDAEARRLGDAKQAAFRAMGRVPLMEGAEACLDALRGGGVRCAVVTGTSRENAAFILGPLAARFDAIVADGDYHRSKPDPEPYLAGASKLHVAPKDCAVVENAVHGVHAARAAGMACLALPSTMPADELQAAGATAIVAGLREVPPWILGQGFKESGPMHA
jgi:HAD superfamily hydrolase (TIGR01509 family)